MSEFFQKIKKFFSKSILIVIIVISIILIFVFKGWIFEQFKHVMSFYYVSQGDKEYFNNNLQEAIYKYNYALKLYPAHVRARYNLGNIYSSYEDFYEAMDCYEKALSYDPDHLNSRMNLGFLLSEEIHNYDRAIEEFDKATKSNHLIMKIPLLFDNGLFIKANIAKAYYNLGLAYKYKSLLYGTGRFASVKYLEKAAENYKKSVQIDPNIYDSHNNYALALHLLGRHDEALGEYCKAINIEPLNYEAHYNLAILLHDKRQFKEAKDELQKTGLILDIKGRYDKLKYIISVLDIMGQKIVPKYDKLGNVMLSTNSSPSQSEAIEYVNGKVVVDENFEGEIMDNFKKCNYSLIGNYKNDVHLKTDK